MLNPTDALADHIAKEGVKDISLPALRLYCPRFGVSDEGSAERLKKRLEKAVKAYRAKKERKQLESDMYVVYVYIDMIKDVRRVFPGTREGHMTAFREMKGRVGLKQRVGLFHWKDGKCTLLQSFNDFPLTKDFPSK